MARILVTGGSGFVGSHTCISLLNSGHKLIVIDSLENSKVKSLEKVSHITNKKLSREFGDVCFIEGDVRDTLMLSSVFKEACERNKKIDGVIHFAGLKSVKESIIKPLLYWDVNIVGTIRLLKVMEKFNCNKFVFSSSATVYGNPEEVPITESAKIQPLNTYGRTKAVAESFLEDIYLTNKNWHIINLRYFNPIGAHPSGLIGEDPLGDPNNLFPIICQHALGKTDSIKIFGRDWPTEDGTGVRDYIHVMDIAEAHSQAINTVLKSESNFLSLNLGTGKGTSVEELINCFGNVNNIKLIKKYTERRKGDCASSYADVNLSNEKLNWQAKRSLEEMCRDGWNWTIKNPNGF